MPMWNPGMMLGFGGWLWMVGTLLLCLTLFAILVCVLLSVIERRELHELRERSALPDDVRPTTACLLERLQRLSSLGESDDVAYQRLLERQPERELVPQTRS